MKIYHYTTIRTLALILKSKKIRFNRLDRVDDMEESIYGSGPFQTKLGQYTFVSCWTKSPKENLALWNMYTRYKGVRIALDEMPFITYKINGNVSLFPNKIRLGEDYFDSVFNNKAELYDVNYIEDPKTEIEKLIIPTDNGGILIPLERIGTFKRKEWSIQQESRFKITFLPADIQGIMKQGVNTPQDFLQKAFESIGQSIAINKPITTPYIDIDLDPTKLADIEILMGPLTDEADRFIVESLLKPFQIRSNAIQNSIFLGKLRDKIF